METSAKGRRPYNDPTTLTTVSPGKYQRTAFSNNVIPQARLNATALYALSSFHSPLLLEL